MQSCLHYVDSWQTPAQSVLAWAPSEYCNMTFKVMLQGYKQTSSPSFYVSVYFRRKQTSLLAQKDSYPPRWQTSAELIDLHPASQPLQVLEFKQSRSPPNNRPFPGEFRGLRTRLLTAICAKKPLGKFGVCTFCIQTPSDSKGLPHSKISYHHGISLLCPQKTTPSVLAAGRVAFFFS